MSIVSLEAKDEKNISMSIAQFFVEVNCKCKLNSILIKNFSQWRKLHQETYQIVLLDNDSPIFCEDADLVHQLCSVCYLSSLYISNGCPLGDISSQQTVMTLILSSFA